MPKRNKKIFEPLHAAWSIAMNYIVNGRRPENLFHFFEQISAIPRESGNEYKIADFVCEFAEKRGLEYKRDAYNNILIRKGASAGYENHPAVLLQGHLDMVCVAGKESKHNFEKDPLHLISENGWLRADGTTLGADDGSAVAVMLAVLDDETLIHPEVECLFTTEEETGMTGAMNFDVSELRASVMINLDSDEEGVATIGCAGGADVNVRIIPDYVDLYGKCLTVTIGGFAGGHSGADIDKERINAITLAARLLSSLYNIMPFNLISLEAGSVNNAIPADAEAVISVSDEASAVSFLEDMFRRVSEEFTEADGGGYIKIRKTGAAGFTQAKMFTFKSTSRLLSFINLAPCGIVRRNRQNFVFAEASSNLASVHSTDRGEMDIRFLVRSSLDITMNYMVEKLKILAMLTDGAVTVSGKYPGWSPVYKTPLQNLFISEYKKLFSGKDEPVLVPIHAGLECGIIYSKIVSCRGTGIDIISIGPEIRDIHTPEERLNLDSFERFWQIVTAMLEKL